MYNLSPKYKRFLFLLIKFIIIIGAFYYGYEKLANNELLSISQLSSQFTIVFSNNIWVLLFILLFTDANWLLEIFKWKTLASIEKKITFFEAYEQCFASLTASIITPNRIGEYGAKALYFKNEIRKKIIFLNLIGNLSQLSITLFFGIIGFVFFIRNFSFQIPKANTLKFLLIPLSFGVLYFFRKKIKHSKIKKYLKKLPLIFY
ncbi:MAG: flippase-like domain-containing protein, partial [Bacteroidetes bacterium]|nr:flippase-like domain-containing protein [Bacteroidota bacterium]